MGKYSLFLVTGLFVATLGQLIYDSVEEIHSIAEHRAYSTKRYKRITQPENGQICSSLEGPFCPRINNFTLPGTNPNITNSLEEVKAGEVMDKRIEEYLKTITFKKTYEVIMNFLSFDGKVKDEPLPNEMSLNKLVNLNMSFEDLYVVPTENAKLKNHRGNSPGGTYVYTNESPGLIKFSTPTRVRSMYLRSRLETEPKDEIAAVEGYDEKGVLVYEKTFKRKYKSWTQVALSSVQPDIVSLKLPPSVDIDNLHFENSFNAKNLKFPYEREQELKPPGSVSNLKEVLESMGLNVITLDQSDLTTENLANVLKLLNTPKDLGEGQNTPQQQQQSEQLQGQDPSLVSSKEDKKEEEENSENTEKSDENKQDEEKEEDAKKSAKDDVKKMIMDTAALDKMLQLLLNDDDFIDLDVLKNAPMIQSKYIDGMTTYDEVTDDNVRKWADEFQYLVTRFDPMRFNRTFKNDTPHERKRKPYRAAMHLQDTFNTEDVERYHVEKNFLHDGSGLTEDDLE